MKVSLNYLKKYLDFELPSEVSEIIDKIGRQLGAVEEVINLGSRYKDVVVVKVVDCQPMGGSDHLKLCMVDDAGKLSDLERDANGLVQVVCGAPNVAKDQLVAWLPPGTVVPATYDKEPLKLEARKMLDHVSNGMLASPKELAIGDSHEGILVIDKPAKPGDSFSKLYDLDDVVIDIENKMFTHRPDCFGLIGVARELAGIFNKPFKSPETYSSDHLDGPQTEAKAISVVNELPQLVKRFNLVVIDGIEVKPSPIEIQAYLSRMGIRPINNIVDATNLAMLETGQPLHAYDYDKLKSLCGGDQAQLTIRYPRPAEKITLLNAKTVEPRSESIMIAAGDHLVGIGGVMGSAVAEVDNQTKTIALEAASFDMYSIRRTSMELGIFSDAVTRFSKGQSPLQTKRVLANCTNLIKRLSPTSGIASPVIDDNHLDEATLSRDSLYPDISVEADFINDRLGSNLSVQAMASLLENVECEVRISGHKLSVKSPFWRTDLEIREDVIEEIGRLFGYQNIEPLPLTRKLKVAARNPDLELKSQVRQILARAGASELLNYSFVSRKLIENANQSTAKAFEIANSLSPELGFYRLSLSPSLIAKIHPNIKAGYDQFCLFEIGSYHQNDLLEGQPAIPKEFKSLALVYSSKKPVDGAGYYKAKAYLDFLLSECDLAGYSYQILSQSQDMPKPWLEVIKPFDPNRSAIVKNQSSEIIGVVGEYLAKLKSSFKLPLASAGFEINLDMLIAKDARSPYRQLSRYPSLKQDITLKIPSGTSYAELFNLMSKQLTNFKSETSFYTLEPISIFQAKDDKRHSNYSFRLTIGDYNRTLSDEFVNQLLAKLTEQLSSQLKAERV